MIGLIKPSELPSVNFADGFLMTKIKANLLAYGNDFSFLNIWIQQNSNCATALLCKFEESFIIVASVDADFEEIKEFITVIGFKNLQAEPFIMECLGLKYKEYQVVFKNTKKGGTLPPMPNIKNVYDLLFKEENPTIKKSNFDGFYVDLSHRIRHNTAAAILKDSAVLVISHITDTAAVISGVAVNSNRRKKGLGTALLSELLKTMDGRKVFAAAEKSVVPFYIKNGFELCGKTAIYETED